MKTPFNFIVLLCGHHYDSYYPAITSIQTF